MAREFRIASRLSRDSAARPEDVLVTKHALGTLGYYRPRDYGLTPYPDEELFSALARFQREKGLAPDGVLKPGGPSEARLRNALSKQPDNRRRPEDVQVAAAPAAVAAPLIPALPHIVRILAPLLGLAPVLHADSEGEFPNDLEERRRLCDQLAEQDEEECRRRGGGRRCWESVQARYSDCLKGYRGRIPLGYEW